jgi:hypothetical protein
MKEHLVNPLLYDKSPNPQAQEAKIMFQELADWLMSDKKILKGYECSTIDEIIRLKIRKPKYVIYEGEYFLCDCTANTLWICSIKKTKQGKYKFVQHFPFFLECNNHLTIFDGYFRIPPQFVRIQKTVESMNLLKSKLKDLPARIESGE